MIAAPLAVLPLAVVAGAVGAVGGWAGLPVLVVGTLVIGGLALGSRGLHLDGLADTADGLAASYDRTRALEIMRRGNTGPIGAATLVLVLLVQVAAAAELLTRPWGAVVLAGLVCLSRCSLLLTCAAGVPSARTEGLGATVSGVVPRPVVALGVLLAAGAGCGLAVLSGQFWWWGLAAVVVGFVVTAALVLRCRRRFGGITGDVLGAGIELMLAASLVVASAG
jgi:adenosylcobinamide-GDP ribazoletransferase